MAYSNEILDRFENPANVGSLDKNDPNVGTGLAGAPACLTGDTLIALADGRKYARLDELAAIGEDLVVYGYNDHDGIRIRRSSPVRLTRAQAEVVEIVLDDGSNFKCTPDHLILLRNGVWCAAKKLKVDESLMPFNRIKRREYFSIYGNRQNLTCNRPAEHRLIYEFFHGLIQSGNQIHHKNHNKFDNRPENLEQLTGAEHLRHHNVIKMHVEGWKPPGRDIVGDKNPMREWWDYRASDEEKRLYRLHMSISTIGRRNGRWSGKTNEELLAFAWNVRQEHGKLTFRLYQQAARRAGYPQNFGQSRFGGSWNEFVRQVETFNHRVVSVKPAGLADVYCVSVADDSCFSIITRIDSHHHTGVVVHNCGDVAKLQVRIDPDTNVILEAKFKGFGCGSLIASSQMACEMIEGKTIDEAEKIKNSVIADGLSLPPVKIHCSLLVEDVVKAAIADWRKKRLSSK